MPIILRRVGGREAAARPVDDAAALQKRRESDEADHALVTRAQQGDRKALGELLSKYGQGLYRSVLLPRLGSEAAAKEALSETYAKVVANIDRKSTRLNSSHMSISYA